MCPKHGKRWTAKNKVPQKFNKLNSIAEFLKVTNTADYQGYLFYCLVLKYSLSFYILLFANLFTQQISNFVKNIFGPKSLQIGEFEDPQMFLSS